MTDLFASDLCGETCRALRGRRAEAMERLAAEHGFLGTLRLRLGPMVSFSLLNYATALLRFEDGGLVASLVGAVPQARVDALFDSHLPLKAA